MKSERFSRTEAVLGKENVKKLNNSFVVVAGLGGVGGYTLEALARMGVMHFRLVDFDLFEESNLNRQLLAVEGNIGSSKTDAALKRLREINSEIVAEKCNLFVDESTINQVLDGNPDVVVDAIDSVKSKCLLINECCRRGISVVSSMGAALRQDPCQVRTDVISRTFGCALAKQVRANTDKSDADKVKCVFSPEHSQVAEKGVLGSLPTVVGTFGLVLAKLAVDEIIG